MINTYKYHDKNGNTYGVQIDHEKKTFKTDPYISISDFFGAVKVTKKLLNDLKKSLPRSGYTETK